MFIPAVVVAGAVFTSLGVYPWIEKWVTGDNSEHHILDRPRNMPTRTAIGVMAISFYGMLWISGGNDIIATTFDLSINAITYTLRVLIFVVPPIAFVITKRICLSLQRRDHDKLLHGIESGNILRTPEGEFLEIHTPLSPKQKAIILGKIEHQPIAIGSDVDDNGVVNPGGRVARLRARLSHWFYGDNVALPTAAELEAAEAHAAHEFHEHQAVIDDWRNLEVTSEQILHSPAIGGHEKNPHEH